MPKIGTFDGAGFWKNAYAHQRGKLLKKVNVPEDQIQLLLNDQATYRNIKYALGRWLLQYAICPQILPFHCI